MRPPVLGTKYGKVVVYPYSKGFIHSVKYEGNIYEYTFKCDFENEIIINNKNFVVPKVIYNGMCLSPYIIDALVEGITIDEDYFNNIINNYKKLLDHVRNNYSNPPFTSIISLDGRIIDIIEGKTLVYEGKSCDIRTSLDIYKMCISMTYYFDNVTNIIFNNDEVFVHCEICMLGLIHDNTYRKYVNVKSARK